MATTKPTSTAAVLEEAGRFASDVLAPLNRLATRTASNSKAARSPPRRAGPTPTALVGRRLERCAGPEEWGGQGLPLAINFACTEMWSAANMAFGLCPLLTASAIEALDAHGSERTEKDLSCKTDLRRMDRHHAADRAAGGLRCRRAAHTRRARARRQLSPRSAAKIFITYGDHDMTDNIVHFVLARLPDAPAGTQGHFAVSGAEVPRQCRRHARRSATTFSRAASSTSSASTARRPAP